MRYVVGFIVIVTPGLALAEEAAAGTAVPWWVQALLGVAGLFGTAVMGLAGKYFSRLTDHLAQEWNISFIANVDEVVTGIVVDLFNTQVKHWKAAASDGKLTDKEKERAKGLALDWAKRLLDWKHVEKLFGGSADEAIGHRIELAVTKAKLAGKTASNSGPRRDP